MNEIEIYEALLKACHLNGISLEYAMYLLNLDKDTIKLIEDNAFEKLPEKIWYNFSKLLGVDRAYFINKTDVPFKPYPSSVLYRQFTQKLNALPTSFPTKKIHIDIKLHWQPFTAQRMRRI